MNHHEKKLVRDRTVEVWNAAPSAEAASSQLNIPRQALLRRICVLRNRWHYQIKFFPFKTQHTSKIAPIKEPKVDMGTQLTGGMKQNGILWTLDEVNEIYEWLFPYGPQASEWNKYPEYFRRLLGRNKKYRWFRVKAQELSGRKGYDRMQKGQGK